MTKLNPETAFLILLAGGAGVALGFVIGARCGPPAFTSKRQDALNGKIRQLQEHPTATAAHSNTAAMHAGQPRDRPPVVVVTGGSRGIGAALCERLGADGYHVVVNYRTDEREASRAVSSIRKNGFSLSTLSFLFCNLLASYPLLLRSPPV
mmetsp:Transcript_50643/g.127206  ORF Transcript_50643/g.127206 Transcript_50643/m.127206 type:complete len:151 (-) Transcript_50643:201-653(-)